MKVLGRAAVLIGGVALMLAIIVAQRDYQRSFGAGAVTQASTVSAATPLTPERIARANK